MAIVEIDLTDANDTLTGSILKDFKLTNPSTTDAPELEAGRTEEIGGYLYRVDGGDLTPTDPGVSDGWVYLYIEDLGASITATFSNTAPTWTGQGWYNSNAKCTHVSIKDGSLWYVKERIEKYYFNDGYVTDTISSVAFTNSVYTAAKSIALTPGRWKVNCNWNNRTRFLSVAGQTTEETTNRCWISDTTGAAPSTSPYQDIMSDIDYKIVKSATMVLNDEFTTTESMEQILDLEEATTIYFIIYNALEVNVNANTAQNIWLRARRLPYGPIS